MRKIHRERLISRLNKMADESLSLKTLLRQSEDIAIELSKQSDIVAEEMKKIIKKMEKRHTELNLSYMPDKFDEITSIKTSRDSLHNFKEVESTHSELCSEILQIIDRLDSMRYWAEQNNEQFTDMISKLERD